MSAIAAEIRFCWNWALDDPLLVLAQQRLGHRRSSLTWSETASACSESSGWASRSAPGAPGADPAADVVGEHPDRADRVAEADLAEPGELLAHRLHPRERDERAHDVVGALEDREDADVAEDLLVGLVAHVAGAALELHRPVGGVPEELGSRDLADRRLERVVLDPAVDQPAGQIAHGLEPEQVGDHPGDLVLDELELGQRAAELAPLLDVGDRQVDQAAWSRRPSRCRARCGRC